MRNPPPPSRPPRRTYRFNTGFNLSPVWVLIILNLLIFIVTLLSSRVEDNLALNPATLASRPWTLLSTMFLHVSFWHLFFNMIGLYFFGSTCNSLIGQNRFLLVYFVGGIIGSVVFVLLNLHEYVYVIGASGAVYAIAGALVVIVPNMRVLFWGIIPMPLWVFVVVFLGILSVPGVASAGIAWEAHLGGLASGLVFGLFFRRRIRYIF
jgi:membrane associated rhomboid family serine protease